MAETDAVGATSQGAKDALPSTVDRAIHAALGFSVASQAAEGYWVGRVESNACMEAQWILALHAMGEPGHPLRARMGQALLREQRPDGSWEVFHDAPAGDINTSVECYAALRSLGYGPEVPALCRARDWILERGGLSKVRVFTKYWLALLGVWPWTRTPNLPPEIIYAPRSFPFHISNFASWARATLMPLAVLSALRPVVPLPGNDRLEELFPGGREGFDWSFPNAPKRLSWEAFFLGVDRVLHVLQSMGCTPGRRVALERVIEWVVRHQDKDGVWGGIQPPWVYSVLALRAFGYAKTHPVLERALGALNDPRWRVDVEDATYMSASVSPVWDTILTLVAIEEAEAVDALEEPVERAVDWVLDQEVRYRGDWSVGRADLEAGGWAFQYENLHYPDTDDTAVALLALSGLRTYPRYAGHEALRGAVERGLLWLLGMQSKGGGWAAFDRDNNRGFLTKIPFCDFGEVLDPPSVDVTAHVLEALARLGFGPEHPAVARGLAFIEREQEADGSWFGRWGVNYVYGTGAVLPALEAMGADMQEPNVQRAADWLVSRQNPDGGWGESCTSYMDPEAKGRGESMPSQTAWALMGLSALARPEDRLICQAGARWLVLHQKDGSWEEKAYTGTGFPGYGVGQHIKINDPGVEERLSQGIELSRAFMINYHMYRHYFPLMALARLRKKGLLA